MHSDVNTRLYTGYYLKHLDRPTKAEKLNEELWLMGEVMPKFISALQLCKNYWENAPSRAPT